MTDTLKRELQITLEMALMLDAKTPVPRLAEKIYEAEPALVESIKKEIVVERFTWMLYRIQQHAKAVSNQLALPGMEELSKLPLRITLKDGKRKATRQANLEQLKEFRAILFKRQDARLAALDKLIALVAEHAKQGLTVTVADAIAAELKKQERQDDE